MDSRCTECEKHPVIRNDYLCVGCRGKIDGKPICEYCGIEEYQTHEDELPRSSVQTRFRGLCDSCKQIASKSVPIMSRLTKDRLVWDDETGDWEWE